MIAFSLLESSYRRQSFKAIQKKTVPEHFFHFQSKPIGNHKRTLSYCKKLFERLKIGHLHFWHKVLSALYFKTRNSQDELAWRYVLDEEKKNDCGDLCSNTNDSRRRYCYNSDRAKLCRYRFDTWALVWSWKYICLQMYVGIEKETVNWF